MVRRRLVRNDPSVARNLADEFERVATIPLRSRSPRGEVREGEISPMVEGINEGENEEPTTTVSSFSSFSLGVSYSTDSSSPSLVANPLEEINWQPQLSEREMDGSLTQRPNISWRGEAETRHLHLLAEDLYDISSEKGY